MKSIKYLSKIVALAAVAIACTLPAKAQMSDNAYGNIDWQFNFPLNNGYADKGSGWGMNFEGGYYVAQNIAVGAFISFHSNNEYFSRRTLQLTETLSLNTDQQHQMFTLPFGALIRYRFIESDFQPYAGLKLGACYSQFNDYYYIFMKGQNRWGFILSPEVGFNYYPWPNSVGFHLAITLIFSGFCI